MGLNDSRALRYKPSRPFARNLKQENLITNHKQVYL